MTELIFSKGQGDLLCLSKSGWDLLQQEVTFPIAVLDQQKLHQNMQWLQLYAQRSGALLAPHGKTAMIPALFLQQIAMGAWGITLATVPQVVAAAQAGVKRIVLANPLVGRQEMRLIADLIRQGLDFYCLVDDANQVEQLQSFFQAQQLQLNLLLEVGVQGGRGGVRSQLQAWQLAQQIQQADALLLCGLEFYEGVIKGPDQQVLIQEFVLECLQLARQLDAQGFFKDAIAQHQHWLISGAGSAWYDVVAETIQQQGLPTAAQLLLRPGCTLFSDVGIYQQAQQQILNRSALACSIPGELSNALEVWAYVLSRPEPELAVVGLGKRDMAFDAGLPVVQQFYRPQSVSASARPCRANPNWQVLKLMDQHALLKIPADADVKSGDMLSFAGSHPCLTLDKWKTVAVLEPDYQIKTVWPTCF